MAVIRKVLPMINTTRLIYVENMNPSKIYFKGVYTRIHLLSQMPCKQQNFKWAYSCDTDVPGATKNTSETIPQFNP